MFNSVSFVNELYRKNWIGVGGRDSFFYPVKLLSINQFALLPKRTMHMPLCR
jgi:hypothetical protein